MSSAFGGPLGGSTVVYINAVAKPGESITFDQIVAVGVVIVPVGGVSSGGISWSGVGYSSTSITAESWAAPSYAELSGQFAAMPFIPPAPTWSLGPKSANIAVSYYHTRVTTSSAEPGVVFYRWGLEPTVGCKAYWEFVVSDTGATLGGFGVGGVLTGTDSEPGKGENPGALLYREGGAWSIWVDGVETGVSSTAAPTRIGVGVRVLAANQVAVQWWLDGVLLNVVPVTWAFDGALWLPVLCTLTDAVMFTLEDAV